MTVIDDQTTEAVHASPCQVVEGYEDQPYCRLTQKIALARLSQLEAAHEGAESALTVLRDLNVGDGEAARQVGLARAILNTLISTVTEDPAPETVPRDVALLAIVEDLQDRISAEPSALLEQAQWVLNTLTSGGWLLVRQADLV